MLDHGEMIFRLVSAVPPIAAAVVAVGSSASAEERPIRASTALHRCGESACLRISGSRRDPAATILVAGHRIVAQGKRNWWVSVPLPAVREWSAPYARSITVEVAGASGGTTQAALPIGLLGHVTEMAYLDVSARR